MLITTNNILFVYNFKKQFTYSVFCYFFGLILKRKKYSYTIDIRIYVWYNNLGTFNSWVMPLFYGEEVIGCQKKIF